ncbi:hypothetical protein COV18_01635 [Candidatus Woesearchaeota archaeon CG10_big_fil_rev_8_21_14_0_10_37_12]|nr:MAG: hypothetical protein COV18_01635 [Candidatus Woesearchaeota archaeon CG10_big_fil_rev_8_21_14_0_10_37_12]
MIEKCDRHRKERIGGCTWCGKRVCELCIVKQEGKKVYCAKCSGVLSGISPMRVPLAAPRPAPPQGRRYMIHDGYLVLRE